MKFAILALISCVLAKAATIASVSGPVDFTGSISSNQAQTAGFSTGQAYNNLQILALINGLTSQTYDAYLTTSIGAGTTTASQVAFATLNFPGTSPGGLTPIFTGLSLGAGTYYLTLFNPTGGSGGWSSTTTPVITTAPGSANGFSGYFITNGNPLAYPPAATFVNGITNGNHNLIYSVETAAPVPEPMSATLVLAGAGLLILRRRFPKRAL